MENLEVKRSYKSEGYVLGNYWGGGQGAYPCIKLESDNLDDLIKQNELALKSGSLDSGMGYESLIGALLYVTTISIICYEGQEFRKKEIDTQFICELTDEQENFLLDCNIY